MNEKAKHFLLDYWPTLVLAVAVIYTTVMPTGFFRVCGDSMYPTYTNGEFLTYDKVNGTIADCASIEKGNVIFVGNKESGNLIKRVVGCPGDEIVIADGELRVNGEVIEGYDGIVGDVDITVPKCEVFVIGDNYNVSRDSRMYGTFSYLDIKGIIKDQRELQYGEN